MAQAKPRPGHDRMAGNNEDGVFLSLLAFTEIRYGIEPLARGRRNQVASWLQSAPPDRFSGRIIAIDDEIAFACVRLFAVRQTKGYPKKTKSKRF